MKQQIAFILKLRGVSALLVIVYHYCYFFWMNQNFCGKLAQHSPVIDVPWIARFLESLPINLGNFGVATFFLISGFLMPIAAQNKTRLEFLKRRIWRIWPTYVIALLLTMVLVCVNSRYDQHQQLFYFPLPSLPWSIGHIVASLFLVRDIGGYPFIDGIVWTLEIEIKFYLLCCIARSWLVEKPIKFVLLIIALAVLSFVLMEYGSLIEIGFVGIVGGGVESVGSIGSVETVERLIGIFFKTMRFVCFMSLGCLFSYVYQVKMVRIKAFMYSLILAILYFGYFAYGGNYAVQWKEVVSYGLAYLLFVGCYMLREKISNRGVMVRFGKISYSLYLVHGVPGFVMMYWMIDQGIRPVVAITVATFCLLLAANMYYWLVENKLLVLLRDNRRISK